MKSLSKRAEKLLEGMMIKNKKGQVMETISGTALSIMTLIFIIFAVLFGISALNPASFFAAGSQEAIQVGNLTTNLTAGVGEFGKQIPTLFKVLGIVMVLGGLLLLVLYILRMRGATGATTSL